MLKFLNFYSFKFLSLSSFLSLSINAKQKFWGVPHLHTCVVFASICWFSLKILNSGPYELKKKKLKKKICCHYKSDSKLIV